MSTPQLPITQSLLPQQRYLDILGSSLPVDERMSLGKLSPDEVPAWADSRVAEYERRIKDIEGHISTFRSLRNAQSPIHVLPSELLGRIFVEACSSRQDLRVAQVCRHWRVVVMGTPQFWANALEGRWMDCSHESERDFLQFALSHSGVLLLYELNIVFEVANAWPIIQPHASRLVSLVAHMDLENQVAALETALSSGRLHNLHSLQVITPMWPSPMWPSPRLSVDARSLPRLRKLHIGGDVFTSTSTFDSLEDLGISGSIRAWEDLACALKPCTALKSLHLYYALPKEEMEEAGDFGLAAVALPKLRTFVLEDQAEQIRKLLQHLALPSSVTSTIHINMRSSADGRTLLDAIPPNYMRRFHEYPLFDRLCLNHDAYLSAWRASARLYTGGQERLQITAYIDGNDDLQGFLEPLFAACEHNPLSTLAIDICPAGYFPDVAIWRGLFERLPLLRRLELHVRTPRAFKGCFATMFLDKCGDQDSTSQSSGLTLAWVLGLGMDWEEEGERVVSELTELAFILERARRCSSLELYAAKSGSDYIPTSLAELPTSLDMLTTVAAPILPRLSGLVDVLTIH